MKKPTQAEKLEALIRRANNNGYTSYPSSWAEYEAWDIDKPYTTFIFNHDFARALFGEKPEYGIKRYGPTPNTITRQDAGEFVPWQFHLQQAVISDNPVDYMYKVVFDK